MVTSWPLKKLPAVSLFSPNANALVLIGQMLPTREVEASYRPCAHIAKEVLDAALRGQVIKITRKLGDL